MNGISGAIIPASSVPFQLYTEVRTLWLPTLPAHNVHSPAIYWNTNLIASCKQNSQRSHIMICEPYCFYTLLHREAICYILKYEPYRFLHTPSQCSYILKYEPYRFLQAKFTAQPYTDIRTLLFLHTPSQRSYMLYTEIRTLSLPAHNVTAQPYTKIRTLSLPTHTFTVRLYTEIRTL